MKPKIIFEDKSFLIIDKPSGMVVNRAKSVKGETVQDWVKKNVKGQTAKDDLLRNGIVHRLDKETSGILVVAKTKKAFSDLQKQFKDRQIKKTYTALVHGQLELKEGEINAPVGRLPWNRERFGVLPGGREAVTRYRAISNFQFSISNEKFTLMELKPITGRTHQIRIHMKHLGHPIVSDTFYAGRKTARNDRKWCPRLFLHASEISFNNDRGKKSVNYKSELPQDLDKCLK